MTSTATAMAGDHPVAKPAQANPAAIAADLPADARAKVQSSVRAFLKSTTWTAARGAGDLGWDCLAAASLADAGVAGADEKLVAIAEQLAAKAIPIANGIAGWAYEGRSANCPQGSFDAFGDGTCNLATTTYSFQTGLGIACLAKAGRIGKRADLLAKAREALGHWGSLAVKGIPCPDCVSFLYSDDANDSGRFVRNVNLFMGYGLATLGVEDDNRFALEIAGQVMRADIRERQAGNKGYLGIADPQWIAKPAEASQNIENHAAAMAVLTLAAARLLDSPADRSHAKAIWEDWATCNNKGCQEAKCNAWGGDATRCQATLTAAHCAFRKLDPRADAHCREYLTRVNSIPSFGLWAILVGGAQ